MVDIQVDVKLSAIWQMTSTVITSGRTALVVDPGYFPGELDGIVRMIPKGAAVEALVFTHSHWDHVVGHAWFPGVPVYASPVLAGSVAEGGDLAARGLRKAWQFDSEWYVERPGGYSWPQDLRGSTTAGGSTPAISTSRHFSSPATPLTAWPSGPKTGCSRETTCHLAKSLSWTTWRTIAAP